MPSKLVVGNWKMYPTLSDALVLASSYKRSLEEIKGVEVVLAPPTAWLVPIAESWRHKPQHISLAAQNVWPNDQGAYTGEVSAYLLKNIVQYSIVGHSERRAYAGEDNDLVHQKMQACLQWGIKPILCVGESKKMIDAQGNIDDYQLGKVTEQLLEGMAAVKKDNFSKVTVAYEPVWAISANESATVATPEYTLQVIAKLKERLIEKFGAGPSQLVRFIYGGSITSSTATDFFRHPEIEGALVGGASVKAQDFLKICQIASRTN
ncbi:MAG: triose-phosphate isomerase [Patescibacteria group bacterium]